MESLKPPHIPAIDLGILDIPNKKDIGSVIVLPDKLLHKSEYEQRDQVLLAGLTREGGYNTSAGYSFSSRLGSINHIVQFMPAEDGYGGLLQIERTVEHIYQLDKPKPIGSIKGTLPFGDYHVNDYFRGEPSTYAIEFRLTSEGLYIPQESGEVKVDEQNQEQMDVAIIVLTAAFAQSVLERIKPAFYTSFRSYPHMELPSALEQFNHGCFLRLHKDEVI